MRRLALFLLLVIPATAFAADRAEEVRKTEIAFAKAFADRDKAAFSSFLADDATFLARREVLSGKAAVVAGWSQYFDDATAPFSWKPERVVVNRAGDLGFSTGPVLGPDGKQFGTYTSTWQRQKDGSWKIIFDGGSDCPAPAIAAVEEGFIDTPDGARLHYSKTGRGSTVIIMPAALFLFEAMAQLGDQATIIAYDMRNRGRSARVPLDKVSVTNDVRDLETVRRHFNVDRFVPMGYSYLGMVVALYAVEHPQRVERMIQIGPAQMSLDTKFPKELTHGYDDMPVPDEVVKRWRAMQASGEVASTPREYCEIDWKLMQFVLVGNPANGPKLKSHCHLETEWPVNQQANWTRLRESIAQLPKIDYRSVTAPVLTIHGTYDRNAPYGSGKEWAATFPNGRLLTLEGAAHAVWVDAPEIVYPAIREFLKQK
jgi:pimeloyl-ACP methyl ester carboxylesterase/ketosteroid isomerase-like protein